VFFSMIPVHNLFGIGIVLGDQIPDPEGSIAQGKRTKIERDQPVP
jgi:hypothetical protein